MSEIITAVYSNGMLHPQSPLSLTDGQTVRLQVLTEESSKDGEKIIQSLVAGLVTPPQHKSDVEPVEEEAWRELTQRLTASGGKPKSRNNYRRTRFNVTAYFVDRNKLLLYAL